ncbi:hypothetical protein ACHAXA_000909 [Cyclostephanos tholiformis]|uniref:NmrA-like domain-containing protein n=1 Tax=Cyclostephanos tholiformis TaxID=382380 RepID=A0ABD3RXA0_9STRA
MKLVLAFNPAYIYPIRGTRVRHALVNRATLHDIDNKPYYANFSTEKVTKTRQRNNANAIPTVNSKVREVGVGKTAIVAGGTGYIGRACVRECVSRGYNTIALVRNYSRACVDEALDGAFLVECDVTNERDVHGLFLDVANGKIGASKGVNGVAASEGVPSPVDIVISCLAAPSGIESDVNAIDYQATLNVLNAGRDSAVGARHFVLLSAFCCRNPILKLQQAKLKIEKKLAEQSEMTYAIVRPTAFFKSVSGQYESILEGNPYVLFGDGAVTRCNPIAAEDLATFMCDSALEEHKEKRWGKVVNVGGPDAPLTNKMLGEMMFKAVNKPAKFIYAPTEIFDLSISLIEFIARTWPSQKWEDVLETSKIGKYYAVEDMLTTDDEEKFGNIRMMDHFEHIAREGQDPFTPVRATAYIAKTLEALPMISISIPIGFGLLTKPDLVQNILQPSTVANYATLLVNHVNIA